jgi:hypothetical protein
LILLLACALIYDLCDSPIDVLAIITYLRDQFFLAINFWGQCHHIATCLLTCCLFCIHNRVKMNLTSLWRHLKLVTEICRWSYRRGEPFRGYFCRRVFAGDFIYLV